ncbi:MAG TPA: protein kinase [Verrucomicrobiae bacterium]|nr:protein kinase [Verrucomicrobiae bacterium]
MTGRFTQPFWIVPLVIAGLVALFGWWAEHELRQTVEHQLQTQLTSALNANVTALEIWTTNQTRLASTLAGEPEVRDRAIQILDRSVEGPGVFESFNSLTNAEELSRYLRPRLRQLGYGIAQLVNTNFNIVFDSMRLRPGPPLEVSEAHTNKFAELFASGEPIIITPFKPELLIQWRAPGFFGRRGFGGGFPTNFPGRRGPGNFEGPGRPGQPPGFGEPGRPNGPGALGRFGGPDRPNEPGTNIFNRPNRFFPASFGLARRGNSSLMQVAAPLSEDGVVRGALALVINPTNEFSRILSVYRTGNSGETYAFDQTGLLISESRFDSQLRTLGLLDSTNLSSALNLRLRDPGGDLTKGYKPEATNAASESLTRLVANAIEGRDGVDVTPSRDYRGVPVIGAWRWLPQLGIGVVTQINAAEAYQSLRVLQFIFIALFLMLVLCSIVLFLFSYANIIWRRRLGEAELKLKQLGQYTLGTKIGEGGMGVVYRAHHALMRRDTAVKLLMPEKANDDAIRRFEREVRLTCRLAHPNTIQVYDYGRTPDGIFYYAMELLSGLNLHDLVYRFGPQPEGRVIQILNQVCESLAEAHAMGLVHRDIKPSNIFLCDRAGMLDWVKVLDFGLVREFHKSSDSGKDEQEFAGTPSFMPPEAVRNSASNDPRSDLYAVGAIGYFLLTGRPPFEEEDVLAKEKKEQTASPAPPSWRTKSKISSQLERAILRCLEHEPEKRPQSALELRDLLLASPQANAYTPEARATWWAEFHRQEQTAVAAETATPSPRPTVNVDFAGRIA